MPTYRDYIPAPDDDFHHWATDLVLYLGTPAAPVLTHPDTMPQLAMESRCPHRNDFDPGQEAQIAHYAFR